MASTNRYLYADKSALNISNEHSSANDDFASERGARAKQSAQYVADNPSSANDDFVGKRGAGAKQVVVRRKSRNSLRKIRESAGEVTARAGLPALEGLAPVLAFLALPTMVVLLIVITGGHWPKSILYTIAIGLGLVVAVSVFKGVELVLAVMLIYLPFSKIFVVPIAPGINGTNVLIVMGLFAAVLRLMATRQKITDFPAGTYLVFTFAILSACSAFTVAQIPGGRMNLMYNEILSYKSWLDQFIFYFIVLMCIRDIEAAKRCIVYTMIGSVLVVLYSVPEMLDKSGRSSIEKMRVGGPHMQSNNFGGFVAYTLLPIVAVFVVYIKDVRAWLLTPYLVIAAKVLVMTFSRGAYLAIVAGAFLVAWYKGKAFVAFGAAIALSFFLVFPSAVPESVMARMDAMTNDANSAAPAEEQLDKSSSVRLILWRAAATMIVEDPIWGKGFKAFPLIKNDYTEVPVKESDPHSMYLFIGAEMGLPSLALFLIILAYSFWLGRSHAQNREDKFIRAIGIGGAAATACFAIVCVFGSRAVSLNFSVYFWTYLVIMQVIHQKQSELAAAAMPKRVRTNAFIAEGAKQRNSDNQQQDGFYALSDRSNGRQSSPLFKRRGKKYPGRKSRGVTRGAAAYQAAVQNSLDNSQRTN